MAVVGMTRFIQQITDANAKVGMEDAKKLQEEVAKLSSVAKSVVTAAKTGSPKDVAVVDSGVPAAEGPSSKR